MAGRHSLRTWNHRKTGLKVVKNTQCKTRSLKNKSSIGQKACKIDFFRKPKW